MRYFVTGATGFIGGRLVSQLVNAGHQVIALVRNPGKAGGLAELGVGLLEGDVTDKESMRPGMQNVDGVFHVAGWYKLGTRDKSLGQKVNVQGTRNVLELMRELQIPKGVYTSTLAVFSDTHGQLVDESYRYHGKHIDEYDRTKWAAHYQVAEPLMAAGLPLVIVLPGLVYGPGDTSNVRATLVQYLQRKLPMLPLETTFCWGFVDDIAAGHILAMEKGRVGESYILGGPPHTLIEAVKIGEKITGIPAPRWFIPPGMMKASADCVSLVEKILPVPEMYSSDVLRSTAGTTYTASNLKAQRELGYLPRRLEDGLKVTLEYELRLLKTR